MVRSLALGYTGPSVKGNCSPRFDLPCSRSSNRCRYAYAPRITVTITDEQAELLNEKTGDDGEYESKNEAVRSFITEYERLSERLEDLERENDRLRSEKRLLLEQREEHTKLVRLMSLFSTSRSRYFRMVGLETFVVALTSAYVIDSS